MGPPVPQEMLPAWQTVAGVHEAPGVQRTQEPEPHTPLSPQLAPSGSASPVSAQSGLPLPQLVVPKWQGLAAIQLAPGVHAPH